MVGRLGAWLARPEGTAEACLQAFDETIRPERAPGALVASNRLHLLLGGRIAEKGPPIADAYVEGLIG